MRLPPFNPRIAIAIAAIAGATTAIFVKLIGNPFAPSIIATYRLLGAVLIMLPIILYKFKHEFSYFTKRDWLMLILSGCFLAGYFSSWFHALQYTSVLNTVFILMIYPAVIFVGNAIFSRERLSFGALISIGIIIFGTWMLLNSDINGLTQLRHGDLLTIVALFLFAGHYWTGQKSRRKVSLITYLFTVYGVATTGLIFMNLFIHSDGFLVHLGTIEWLSLIGLAIIPTFLGVFVFNWVIKWARPITVSIGMLLEPIIATILAYVILGEVITVSQWIGVTVLFFGLYLFIMSTSKKRTVTISKKE